jgi:glycosyltransferase involved in cell wall biosynthesis
MTTEIQDAERESDERADVDRQVSARRICMVVHASYPRDTRVRRQADAAFDGGHPVDVICLRDPGEAKSEVIRGVHVRRLPIRHVPGATPWRMVFEYLLFTAAATLVLAPSTFRRRYQVIHVNNPPDFLIIAGLLPRLSGSRLILDVHDLSSHMFQSRFKGRKGRIVGRALDLIERWAARLAQVVLTVHEPYRRELLANGVPAEKVVVMMNVADQVLLSAVEPHERRSGSNEFIVAYSGTVTPWYGVELIVDALGQLAPKLPKVRGLILGGGDALDAVRTRTADRGLGDRVTFTGWLPAAEALGQMSQASCGVIPNLPTELNRFALSTKLFEYIGIGIPVVVANLETLRSHFDDTEVTFFTAGDAGSLADALEWVATHPDEAIAKTRRARERVASQYSWPMNRERYIRAVEGR